MSEIVPLGPGAWAFVSIYLSSLLGIGWLGRRAMRTNTLADFYLGGRQFGVGVLLFTLFATQYSGNTFFGFSGITYRIGFTWIMSMQFMTAVVVVYLIFAPRLHRLAGSEGFITPPDFLMHRFRSRTLATLAALVMIVALANYLLAQLMAMGRAMEGLAGREGAAAYRYGVIALALIMVVYGTLGGLRAVAWTDAIQGVMLGAGFAVLAVILAGEFGGLAAATRILAERDARSGTTFTTPPDAAACRQWLSYILVVGFGSALYPQAIQRIYAARSLAALRRSLAVMALLPIPTMAVALAAGIIAAAHLPGLEGADSDAALGRLMARTQETSAFAAGLVVVMIAALLAAMMSTADSALLSISSMVTKDVFARWMRPGASERGLTAVGKLTSWMVLAGLVWLAIALRGDTSLVSLLDRKFDVLVQLVPAFFIGIHWRGLERVPVVCGLVAGLAVALLLAFLPLPFTAGGKVYGFHAGLVALVPNLVIAVGGSLWHGPKRRRPAVSSPDDRSCRPAQ